MNLSHDQFTKLVSKILLFLSLLASGISCTSPQARFPSSTKGKADVVFNLYGQQLPPADYSFELIDLDELMNSQVKFSRAKIADPQARKVVDDWMGRLKGFVPKVKTEIAFEFNKVPISAKSSDFKRLDKALELIANQPEDASIVLRKQVAIISAFNENFKDPIGKNIELFAAPVEALKLLSIYKMPVEGGQEVESVTNSSFWTKRDPSTVNMSRGPSDLDTEKIFSQPCTYGAPKRGFGINQGFKIKCTDGTKFKLKFGEVAAGPLNSRIYHRLGYNVPAIHIVPFVQLKYEQKMFTQMNSGKKQFVRVKVLGKEKKAVEVRKKNSFSDFTSHFITKTGEKISAEEGFKKLWPSCTDPEHTCHLDPSKFDTSFESTIDYIVFDEVSVTEDTDDHEFGGWNFDDLDYKNRIESKSLLLLGAFSGNHDLRKDNNSIVWTKNFEIKHYISDPGSGYGSGRPFSPFSINAMKWEILAKPPSRNGEVQNFDSPTLLVENYFSNAEHKSFYNLTKSEAKWIGRQIASISEDELTEALASVRLSAAELLLLREILISRQKNIVEMLDLKAEFPELAQRKIDKKINYTPSGATRTFELKNGKKLIVEDGKQALKDGKIVST